MSITLDTRAYLDVVRELLESGHTNVPVTISGTSMTPFLDPGDTVYLNRPAGGVRAGDVVLFSRPGGRYILHRVIRVFPDGSLEILGDAQTRSEIQPDDSHVWGVVTGALHGKKQLTAQSLRWRFFAGPWSHAKRSRYYVNRIRSAIRRRTGWTL